MAHLGALPGSGSQPSSFHQPFPCPWRGSPSRPTFPQGLARWAPTASTTKVDRHRNSRRGLLGRGQCGQTLPGPARVEEVLSGVSGTGTRSPLQAHCSSHPSPGAGAQHAGCTGRGRTAPAPPLQPHPWPPVCHHPAWSAALTLSTATRHRTPIARTQDTPCPAHHVSPPSGSPCPPHGHWGMQFLGSTAVPHLAHRGTSGARNTRYLDGQQRCRTPTTPPHAPSW